MRKLERLIDLFEKSIVIGLILVMLGLASLDIIMRLFELGGINWLSKFLRLGVLWLALLGALIATKTNEHIRVDLINRMVKNPRVLDVISLLFASLVSFALALPSYNLVIMTFEFEDKFFSNIPLWTMQLLMPLTFLLMGIRFLILAFKKILNKERTKNN